MITELVTFTLPSGTTRDEVLANYEKTAEGWLKNPDLIRKYYVYDAEQGTAGGVYLWWERSHAERWHGAEFRARVQQLYGAEPHSRFFETPIVVDNTTGIISRG